MLYFIAVVIEMFHLEMLQYTLANTGCDTAESEPSKSWQALQMLANVSLRKSILLWENCIFARKKGRAQSRSADSQDPLMTGQLVWRAGSSVADLEEVRASLACLTEHAYSLSIHLVLCVLLS